MANWYKLQDMRIKADRLFYFIFVIALVLPVAAKADDKTGIIYNSNEKNIPRIIADDVKNNPAVMPADGVTPAAPSKDLLRGDRHDNDRNDPQDQDHNHDHDEHDRDPRDRDKKRSRNDYRVKRPPSYVYVNPTVVVVSPPVASRNPRIAMIDRASPFVETTCEPDFSIGDMAYTQVAGLVPMQFSFRDNDPVGVKGGSIIGVLTGDQIGNQNEQCAAEALEYAAPGTQIVWRDAATDDAFMVQPIRTFDRYDHTCREFVTRIEIDGAGRQAYGTACRDKTGGWSLDN